MLASDLPENHVFVCCFLNKIKNGSPRTAIIHPAVITIAHRYDYDEAERRAVVALGFKDDVEYANMYPGGFKLESALSKLMNLDTDVSDPDASIKILNMSTDSYCNKRDPKSLKARLESLVASKKSHIMASVTMDAIRGCSYFSKMGDDDLWFCTDWKG